MHVTKYWQCSAGWWVTPVGGHWTGGKGVAGGGAVVVVVVVVDVVVTGGEVAGPVGAYFVKNSIKFLNFW